jgi:hypothetical protein
MRLFAVADLDLLAPTTQGEGEALPLVLAMLSGQRIGVFYEGEARVLEVHAIGRGSDGQLLVRAFQTDGYSSRKLPAWGLFRLEKLKVAAPNPVLGPERSLAPRPGYARGDKQMQTVLFEVVP